MDVCLLRCISIISVTQSYLFYHFFRRMSHAKDPSIYTGASSSGVDAAVMSSGASSLSTEYVSLNSTGASYHTLGISSRNAQKYSNTFGYDSSYGTVTRDHNIPINNMDAHQITDAIIFNFAETSNYTH